MDYKDNHAFNWVVKRGNIILLVDNDKMHIDINKEINKEINLTCLLTKSDVE